MYIKEQAFYDKEYKMNWLVDFNLIDFYFTYI